MTPAGSTDAGTTAVIYCRVSTDDKGQTTETQERECRNWCKAREIEVLEVYKDEQSGTTAEDRPQFSQMLLRIQLKKDADWVVAYDQSRITRSDDIEDFKALLKSSRCRFRFVSMDLDLDNIAGQIVQDVNSRINANDNKVRNEKVVLGMQTAKIAGKHVGRPARFMFAEDVATAPKGRFKADYTKTCSEDMFYDWARHGLSIGVVARDKLSIDIKTLKREARICNHDSTKCRDKGTKDRYTVFCDLYNAAIAASNGGSKGGMPQRSENPDEIGVQRGEARWCPKGIPLDPPIQPLDLRRTESRPSMFR